MTERHTDDDIARTLRDDPGAPPPDLDARIRAAAREALRETSAPSTRRRWRVPAGAAVAATVLLAVLVIERASPPDSVPEPVPAPQADALEEHAPALRPAPPAATREAQRLRALPGVYAPMADDSRAPARETAAFTAGVVQRCEEGTRALTAAGLLLCIGEDYLQVHDISGEACRSPLRLERGTGEISATPAIGGVDVLVDGTPRWRVRCDEATWVVTPAAPADGSVPAARHSHD
jgi:hypothetical protein